MTDAERRRHEKYNNSPKGLARRRRYERTRKARQRKATYDQSEKGRARDLRYKDGRLLEALKGKKAS